MSIKRCLSSIKTILLQLIARYLSLTMSAVFLVGAPHLFNLTRDYGVEMPWLVSSWAVAGMFVKRNLAIAALVASGWSAMADIIGNFEHFSATRKLFFLIAVINLLLIASFGFALLICNWRILSHLTISTLPTGFETCC